MVTRAVFLDRDGVINRAVVQQGKPYPPFSLEELVIPRENIVVFERLSKSGYILLGVTNQPDVARGNQTREVVEAINAHLLSVLPLKELFVCYHDEKDDCSCRKPKPGLILQGASKYGIDLTQSWMVGDRWKDVSAGKAAGLKTVFINYNYAEKYYGPPADFVVENITAIAEIILNS
jgi:D-glycero-D-manno-heptose 1,7-bisphosphate phosphatase